tara:strand:- start:99483 stop:100922 length:1440 start_codon:yes stop_codon:yes gene_type:complete
LYNRQFQSQFQKRLRLKSVYPAIGMILAAHLAACSSSDSTTMLGATTSSGLETKFERESYGAKKIDLQPTNLSFAGAVIADEPTAALIARTTLEKGGNAADAATALYFALSVTYPAAAGLGGGGACLVRDAETGDVSSVSFLTRKPMSGGAFGVPGNVRGFAIIQARFGSKPWAQLVSPAERLAATGMQTSRATARQLSTSQNLTRQFTKADGSNYGEAEPLRQIELASTLARIRARGVVGFYQGDTAHLLVAASDDMGGGLTSSDLSQYLPGIVDAPKKTIGELDVSLLDAATKSGAFSENLWADVQNASTASAVEAAGNAAAASVGESANGEDMGATSFVTIDGKGGAVACSLTMNGSFGTGKAATGTGVVFAPAASSASAFLTPVIVDQANAKDGLYVAAAGAGAPKAGASALAVVAAALSGQKGAGDRALAASPANATSPANAIVCSEGLPRGTCRLSLSPDSAGVGLSAVSTGS